MFNIEFKIYDINNIELNIPLNFGKGHFIINMNNGHTYDFKFSLDKQNEVKKLKELIENKLKNILVDSNADFGTFIMGINYLGGIPELNGGLTKMIRVT